jgi:hypothetical protein
LLDKTESVTTENTTSALSHLAFCALAALGLVRQNGIASTPYAENLFLIRWLATAQKHKRFPKRGQFGYRKLLYVKLIF